MRSERIKIALVYCLFMVSLFTFAALRADDYRVGPGDLLKINVFDHAELMLEARVSQSGNITYPLIGVIQVGGLSTHQVETLIAQRLSAGAYIKQPQVSVDVGDFQSQKVGVVGQVNKPGQYSLTGAQNVLDVLTMAGGLVTEFAADDGTLIHKDGSTQPIDLRRLLDGDQAMNIPMVNGDTLSVPRAAQFYIYGEVQKPGSYRLGRNMTVSQGVSTGGGLTKNGTERRAIVKRRDSSGKEKEYSIKPTDLLQPNDVLLIKHSLF
jgi:polysaccharide export outer membrane protein